MLIASMMLLIIFFVPIWNITLEAPQYPTPLGMNIHINKLANHNPNDLQNINLMNHYVGMKSIPETLNEFKFFPFVIIFMALLGILLAIKAKPKYFVIWLVMLIIAGVLGMYDFYLWEYDYGHNLSPHAAIKFTNPDGSPMAYQPPLLGTKKILNFTAHSYPRIGTFILILSFTMVCYSYIIGVRETKRGKSL